MNEKPLVSVGVFVYNSSNYILETLESIKDQSYDNLELIISDDYSTDDSLKLCEEWAEKHKNRFKRVVIVKTDHNTGVSANANRTFHACEGEWTKIIAGDDLLLPDCVSTYIDFIKQNPGHDVIFGRVKPFVVINDKKKFMESSPKDKDYEFTQKFNDSTAVNQFRMLLSDGCFPQAPTLFCRTAFIKENPFTEKYKYEEDYPMWLKLTKQGSRLYILFKETVMYRKDNSLSRRKNDYYSRCYMSTRELLFWNECLDYFKQENLPDAYARYRKVLLRYELTEAFLQNRKNKFNSVILKIFDFFINRFAKYEL